MGVLSVRNLPDEIHRALRARAASHGRSTEAEVRAILETAVRPKEEIGLGTLLANIAKDAGVTNEDADELMRIIEQNRDRTPVEPMVFDE